MQSLESLDACLHNGLRGGRWAFFHDVNNQSGLFVNQDPEAIDYLLSIKPAQVPLRTNCRNTLNILEKVQTSLGADMGIRGAGEGPKIREHIVATREASAEALAREIREIVEESSVSLLEDSLKREILILDEYSLRNTPFRKTNFAEISNFKGLENEAVIIADIESPVPGVNPLTMHYVAMSRARAVLSLIYLNVNPLILQSGEES
jgi:hypothetical protein